MCLRMHCMGVLETKTNQAIQRKHQEFRYALEQGNQEKSRKVEAENKQNYDFVNRCKTHTHIFTLIERMRKEKLLALCEYV